jgi:Protein of unknown function (DUF3489)
MSIKLTDSQLVMLSAASQRDDRCLEQSKRFKGSDAPKLAEKLIKAGLAREVQAKAGMPVWRRDDEAGRSYALKLTAAGLRAIAVDEDEAREGSKAAEESTGPVVNEAAETSIPPTSSTSGVEPIVSTPREGSKIGRVIALLQRDQGATLEEIVAATDWLPHTSRAALTGLRKRGFAIERLARAEGGKGYLIASATSRSAA